MVFDRFARALPVLATAVALAGCVTIGPVGSPTLPQTAVPTASPAPTAPPTATPTATPTAPPTPSPTAPPTAPPTDSPTAKPTAPPTTPPTDSPTTPPTTGPTSPPDATTLDPNLTARYGSLDPLDSGFTPDPQSVSVVSGGPIDVSYVGGVCTGFAEANPDYEVHYNGGLLSMLRFYFVADVGSEDPTLIINDTAGNWQCDDDSYGTNNPSIDFSPPLSGWYDIWVGSYSSGKFIPGTLYITELDSNHP